MERAVCRLALKTKDSRIPDLNCNPEILVNEVDIIYYIADHRIPENAMNWTEIKVVSQI